MLSTLASPGLELVADADQLSLVAIVALLVLLVVKEVTGGLHRRWAKAADRILPIPIVPLLVAFAIIAGWHMGGIVRWPF